MKQFKSMFPHLSQDTIENVLRRHSGNVGLAVDELLSIAESVSFTRQKKKHAK